jgi:hypothetical protein
MKQTLIFIAILLAAANILAVGNVAQAAGSAAFSVTASANSLTVGSNVSFSLYENGGTVNVVTGTFSYDSSKLKFISSSCAGSFSNTVVANNSSVSCYVAPGTTVSGSQKFASLTFTSLATGSTALTVTGSQIASAGANIWNGAAASKTVTIKAATTPTPIPTSIHPTSTPAKPTATPTKSGSAPIASTGTPSTTPTPTQSGQVAEQGQITGVKGASATPTPSTTTIPLVVPTTQAQGKSHSNWPWAAAGVAAILVAAAGAYYWFFRKN